MVRQFTAAIKTIADAETYLNRDCRMNVHR